MTAIITLTLVFTLMGLAYYFDARYGWQFVAWMNGTTENPFISANKKSTSGHAAQKQNCVEKEKEISALRKRVETLEAIVTDSTYELNQKINRL